MSNHAMTTIAGSYVTVDAVPTTAAPPLGEPREVDVRDVERFYLHTPDGPLEFGERVIGSRVMVTRTVDDTDRPAGAA